jgi:hypothetical protein
VSPVAGRAGAALLFAAALAGQGLLQRPLGRSNEVRASREIHTPPSSLAFRLTSGGIELAASDALWLTVLPRLSRPWADPERKAVWIESVTNVLIDSNPRAITPPLYAGYFLGFLQNRHPGIERVLRHAMEAESKTPFRERRRVNEGTWWFPHDLGMDMVQYGNEQEKAKGMEWLRRAAAMPDCPTILIDYLAAIGRRSGDPLAGWVLWFVRAATTTNPRWRERFLRDADRSRREILRGWAREAEGRLGRRPKDLDEILSAAPAAVLEGLRAQPDRLAAFREDVAVHPEMRDVEVVRLTKALVEQGLAHLRLLARKFEASMGRRPRNLLELESAGSGPVEPPPRYGTRWSYDPETGEPGVVPDPADPRTRE